MAFHVRQPQLEEHDVVVVVADEFEGFRAGVAVVDDGAAALEREAEAAGEGEITLDEQDTHGLLQSATKG